MISKTSFQSSPHIGIFCTVNDEVAVTPLSAPRKFEEALKETLDVDIVKTTLSNTSLIGIFSVANNKKIIVPDILEKGELKILKEHFPEVLVLEEKYTAVGNLVAMNDKGIACSKYLRNALSDALSIRIADSDLVGSTLFVSNAGFLCHRDASAKELKEIEHIFKVKGDATTINLGDPFIKSGLLGNKNGILAGALTSGPELNRIDDVFMFK
jgi:translation initiation factor 6